MSTYTVGPTLTHDERPWPLGWEQDPRIDDGHAHEWESVLLAAGPGRGRVAEVVRCHACYAPRCGHASDDNPCLRRRHHRDMHHLADGTRYPIGGRP